MLELDHRPRIVTLRVADDGCGPGSAPPGGGLHGMRERAVLVGAQLTISNGSDAGTEVLLRTPVDR